MPELAEVAWFARQWEPGLGHRVTEVLCREKARIFRTAEAGAVARGLKGRRLTQILTHGKQMLFTFDGANLGLHLGMTGELLVAGARHEPEKHDHLVIRQGARSLVFRDPRMFGALRFDAEASDPTWWRALPPEILSAEFTGDLLARHTERRARSPLKAFLLDQEIFPGVGNWMADEILWRARIHPGRKVGRLKSNDIIILRKEVRHVSRRAMAIVAVAWGDFPDHWLFNHRWRDGGRCPRDGTLLRREEIGGRTTAWCPRCQRGGRGL
jgi:formamidopyrimidine-DNA glycosylase